MVRGILALLVFVPWTLFIIVTGVPLSFLSPDYLHAYARLWGRFGLVLAGVRLQVEGQELLPQGQPVIYMANHQSNLDILALFAGLPGQFRWLAKAELFRIPLFGLAMRRAGYIPVDRSDRRKSMQSMAEAAARIAGGASVVIFPEGTRSEDGRLLPFKKGGFILALQSQVPAVPVAVVGSRERMAKHTLRLSPGTVRIRILEPIPTAGRTVAERDALMEEVRAPIAAALGQA